MYQHVTQPTRGRREDAPSLLDLILTNEQEMVSALKCISPLGKSDHAVLQFTCCFRGVAKPSNSLRLKKCYNKADYLSMREKVKKDINKDTSSDSTVEEKYKLQKQNTHQSSHITPWLTTPKDRHH